MQFSILTAKTESFYTACSPELAVITYGECRDEAVNNLQDVLRTRDQTEREERHAR
jgi:predicted RNase H-like HicB family nuclease